jgi:hypothetical protein
LPDQKQKKKIAIGYNGLWAMNPASDRTGIKPISPIPTSIPMMQMFDFVTLNGIRFILV